jgi:hypothetical protein
VGNQAWHYPAAMNELVQHSLLYGVLLSGVLTVIILGSLRYNPEIWLHRYPKPVLERYGQARNPRSERQRLGVTLLFLVADLALPLLGLLHFEAATGHQLSYREAFLSTYLMFFVFNLVDLLLIDWGVLVLLSPRWARLPGTEEEPSYQSYGMHLRGFVSGLGLTLLPSALLATLSFIR